MKKLIFVLLGCLFLATDCNNGDDIPNCEEPLDAFRDPLIFQLVSPNGQTLIGESGTLYESKDVTVTNMNGQQPNKLQIGGSGIISFIVPADNDQIDETLEKDFYLVLPPTGINPSEDIDTIQTTYKLVLEKECNVTWYEAIEISFNDSLYHSGDFPLDKIKFIKF